MPGERAAETCCHVTTLRGKKKLRSTPTEIIHPFKPLNKPGCCAALPASCVPSSPFTSDPGQDHFSALSPPLFSDGEYVVGQTPRGRVEIKPLKQEKHPARNKQEWRKVGL